MLNGLQRIRQQRRAEGNESFLSIPLRECLNEPNILNLEELLKIGGPRIWTKVGNRIASTSPFFSCMCKAMAKMLELNEESNNG